MRFFQNRKKKREENPTGDATPKEMGQKQKNNIYPKVKSMRPCKEREIRSGGMRLEQKREKEVHPKKRWREKKGCLPGVGSTYFGPPRRRNRRAIKAIEKRNAAAMEFRSNNKAKGVGAPWGAHCRSTTTDRKACVIDKKKTRELVRGFGASIARKGQSRDEKEKIPPSAERGCAWH